MAAAELTRASAARRGVLLEAFSLAWMLAEAAVAIGAGIAAHSVLLTTFGFDSVIELLSAAVLMWRLSREARGVDTERLEHIEIRATQLSAGLLVALCVYVVATSVAGLVARVEPEASVLGLGVAVVALVVMPALAVGKRAANRVLRSPALRADIAETTVCAYMAGTVVVGVGLNQLAGWWWAEYAAAAVLLFWLIRETREAVEAAHAGRTGHDDDD